MIPPGKHGEHMAELVRLRRDMSMLVRAVLRVRELHSYSYGFCNECSGDIEMVAHPCPTIRALDAPTTTDEEG